jgi:TrwC relaxase
VPLHLIDAFSARGREVARAAEKFRAKWGRAPEPGELRQLKLDGRKAKTLVTRTDLQRAWDQTAARHEYAGLGLDYSPDRQDAISLSSHSDAGLLEHAAPTINSALPYMQSSNPNCWSILNQL